MKRRFNWRTFVLLDIVGGTVLFVALALAATHRPAWYRPVAVDHDRLRDDKAALVKVEQDVSRALNAGQPLRFELREEQLNRWIAARGEMWPNLGIDLGKLSDPMIVLRDGAVHVGALATQAGLQGVVTMAWRIGVDGDTVRLTCSSASLGAIPLPRSTIVGNLSPLLRSGLDRVDSSGVALILANRTIWPNGKRPCRLTAVEIHDGLMTVELQPDHDHAYPTRP